MKDAEQLAQLFHETYERLAPSFGYETRKASAVPWEEVPENNKRLMIAVCEHVLNGVEMTKHEKKELREMYARLHPVVWDENADFRYFQLVDGEWREVGAYIPNDGRAKPELENGNE